MDYSPLWVTLKTCGVAIVFVFFLGWRRMFLASRSAPGYLRYRLHHSHGAAADGLRLPSVVGARAQHSLWALLPGDRIPARVQLAGHGHRCGGGGLPAHVSQRPRRLRELDPNMLDAARTLGFGSNGRIFMRLMLPFGLVVHRLPARCSPSPGPWASSGTRRYGGNRTSAPHHPHRHLLRVDERQHRGHLVWTIVLWCSASSSACSSTYGPGIPRAIARRAATRRSPSRGRNGTQAAAEGGARSGLPGGQCRKVPATF